MAKRIKIDALATSADDLASPLLLPSTHRGTARAGGWEGSGYSDVG